MSKVFNVKGTAKDSSGYITFEVNVGATNKTEARILVQDRLRSDGLSDVDANGQVVFLGSGSAWPIGHTLWLN